MLQQWKIVQLLYFHTCQSSWKYKRNWQHFSCVSAKPDCYFATPRNPPVFFFYSSLHGKKVIALFKNLIFCQSLKKSLRSIFPVIEKLTSFIINLRNCISSEDFTNFHCTPSFNIFTQLFFSIIRTFFVSLKILLISSLILEVY